MVTLADVRRWDPGGLEGAFTSLGRVRDHLLDLDDDLGAARPSDTDWRGAAADGARATHDALAERMRHLAAEATAARLAIADAADAVAAVLRDLRTAEDGARGNGFGVAPDGTVTDERTVTLPVEQVAAHRQRRAAEQAEIVRALQAVLDRASTVDGGLRAALARAADGGVDDGDAASLTDAALAAAGSAGAPFPPADGTPRQNADWWRGLSNAEQERLILAHPDVVGGLDGVPAAARDEANRARLPDEIARVDAALDDARWRWRASLDEPLPAGMEGQGETAQQRELRERVERLTGQHDALAAISRTVRPADRQLLLLDVDGGRQPRAAVAVGDVDTARDVGVFTPGFTSTVAGSLPGYTADMVTLRHQTEALLDRASDGGGSVATVAWMGYDAPQWSTVADPGNSVAAPFAARRGGEDLARFYQGISASRPADDPHLVALGHSYGSTTTGYALQHAPVDDAVFFGSPGLGTGDVSDLQVPSGHTSVVEARDDAVADLGAFGPDPNHLDGVTRLESGASVAPDGRALRGSTGHSEYLVDGTTSQRNIAATLAGLPDQRILGDDTGFGDYLNNPVQASR